MNAKMILFTAIIPQIIGSYAHAQSTGSLLDSTFGQNGMFVNPCGITNPNSDAPLEPCSPEKFIGGNDGEITVYSNSYSWKVLANGSVLDSNYQSFDSRNAGSLSGTAINPKLSSRLPDQSDLFLQPTTNTYPNFLHLLPNGNIDSNFKGAAMTDVARVCEWGNYYHPDSGDSAGAGTILAATSLSDGSMIVAIEGDHGINYWDCIVKFLPNGSLDMQFGNGGSYTKSNSLLFGDPNFFSATADGGFIYEDTTVYPRYSALLIKIDSDGFLNIPFSMTDSPDPTNFFLGSFGPNSVTGGFYGRSPRSAIWRYNANGSFDPSFKLMPFSHDPQSDDFDFLEKADGTVVIVSKADEGCLTVDEYGHAGNHILTSALAPPLSFSGFGAMGENHCTDVKMFKRDGELMVAFNYIGPGYTSSPIEYGWAIYALK